MSSLIKNWQKDYKERCKFLFNSDTLSDVKFVVQASQKYGERDSKRSKMEIPAHKFLLSICSPVFFAMFCSEMAETKEHIDLPDCEYEGMLELFRYIYTDEVCLNGNNVMQVLYVAEKYMISCLANECSEYLRKNLDSLNVFCVLRHAHQYGKDYLVYQCWDFIDRETYEVIKTREFVTIEKSLLKKLVERDTLTIRELELFKAVDCWAKEECKRQQLKADGTVKRQVLGEQILQMIRFPVMEESEFMEVVLDSSILTEKETNHMMKYFSSTLTSPVGFLETERMGSPIRCCRFREFFPGSYWANEPEYPSFIQVTVDKDIMLHGVCLLGYRGNYAVTLKICSTNDGSVLATESGNFTPISKECAYGYYHTFDVLLDLPVLLKKNVKYCIEAVIDGPDSCAGKDPLNDVCCAGVTFTFFECHFDPDYHFDGFMPGHFAELLFKIK
ncbi:BTB/POZ domain-containing protein 6-like [Oculina patagonica]